MGAGQSKRHKALSYIRAKHSYIRSKLRRGPRAKGFAGDRAALLAQLRAGPRGDRQKCQGITQDRHVWHFMLHDVYGVPEKELGRHRHQYTEQMAEEDLAACKRGKTLRHAKQVALFHQLDSGVDVRLAALKVLHGFTDAELAEKDRMRDLKHYTRDMALQNLQHFARTESPRYHVSKYTSQVTDTLSPGTKYLPGSAGYRDASWKYTYGGHSHSHSHGSPGSPGEPGTGGRARRTVQRKIEQLARSGSLSSRGFLSTGYQPRYYYPAPAATATAPAAKGPRTLVEIAGAGLGLFPEAGARVVHLAGAPVRTAADVVHTYAHAQEWKKGAERAASLERQLAAARAAPRPRAPFGY